MLVACYFAQIETSCSDFNCGLSYALWCQPDTGGAQHPYGPLSFLLAQDFQGEEGG